MSWTSDDVQAALHEVVKKLAAIGVPMDRISSAMSGVGIRLALESGIGRQTIHSLVDDIHKQLTGTPLHPWGCPCNDCEHFRAEHGS